MDLIAQLIRDEGLLLRPYRDTVGKLTIGVGRNLEDTGITREEALYLLQNDILSTSRRLYQALPWVECLDDVRRGVIIHMAFNLGVSGLLRFEKTLKYIQRGHYRQASVEMLNSEWAAQVGVRAQRLATQLVSGEWQ